MLTIKCARCKAKVLKYLKMGEGRVLRCYQKRIRRLYGILEGGELRCSNCRNRIGIQKRGHIKMNQKEFTAKGQKIPNEGEGSEYPGP